MKKRKFLIFYPDPLAEQHLHIISFDIPYPATYGGVIDVFYKIRALSAAGIKVHLHCFEYHRKPAAELEKHCHTVHYYRRDTGIRAIFSKKPYIVAGRRSAALLNNLQQDNYSILFEGLHSCYYLDDKRLENRFKIYRESNIEHHYYFHLFKAEKKIWKKMFFYAESKRLKFFQSVLKHASLMLTVSEEDTEYLRRHFPDQAITCLPSFHREENVGNLTGKGRYLLYQGNLSVPENLLAAEFLIRDVMDDTLPELIIAGMNPPESLQQIALKKTNVRIIPNPTDEEMFNLIRNAQVNIMVTFQSTGLKLKLLHALFNGRFCLVNPAMLAGTNLEILCEVANNPVSFRNKIMELFPLEFTEEMMLARQEILAGSYSNQKNCKTLLKLLPLS